MSLKASHTQRALHLYRHSLKNILSWAIRRDIFNKEVGRLKVSTACLSGVQSTEKSCTSAEVMSFLHSPRGYEQSSRRTETW